MTKNKVFLHCSWIYAKTETGKSLTHIVPTILILLLLKPANFSEILYELGIGFSPWHFAFCSCFLKKVFIFYSLYGWFECMYVCVSCVFLEIKKGHESLWDNKWLWAALWVLGIKQWPSGRTASALNHWASLLYL